MPAQPESYSIATGEVLAGGRYASRPYLVVLGHSIVGQSQLDPSTVNVPMIGIAPHKWLNTLLGMPFDYIHCNIDKTIINPPSGSYGRNLVNGFYGQSGNTSGGINTRAAQLFVDLLSPIAGNRRVVAALMAEINDLTGGIAPATIWANYQSMMAKFSAAGWKTLLSTAPPSTGISTTTERDNVAAWNAMLDAALPSPSIVGLMDWTTPYVDTSNANGYQVPISGYTSDGTHLQTIGAFVLGLSGAAALAGKYPRWKPKASDVVCSQNPTLMTSGGTLGTNASGVVPAGFALNANGTGCSVVGSYGPDYYQMSFSYSGGLAPYVSQQGLLSSSFMANAVVGSTVVQNICDVEIVECTNYQWQALNEYGSGTGQIPYVNEYTTEQWMDAAGGMRICLHTEPHVVPGDATRSTTSFGCRPIYHAAAASLTVRIRWIGTKHYG